MLCPDATFFSPILAAALIGSQRLVTAAWQDCLLILHTSPLYGRLQPRSPALQAGDGRPSQGACMEEQTEPDGA